MSTADWPTNGRTSPRGTRPQREKSRVTVQLSPAEMRAVKWLNRCPKERDELPEEFQLVHRSAERNIVRELSGEQLKTLVELSGQV